jgi:hypothetical protein
MNHHIASHAAKAAAETIKALPPLHNRKSPLLAFIIGFFFGPLGIGIYFQSAKDFLICLGMLFAGMLFFGVGVVLGWLFSACYGAWRAYTSNERLN